MIIAPVSTANSYCNKSVNFGLSNKEIIQEINKKDSFNSLKQSKTKKSIIALALTALTAFSFHSANKTQNVITVPCSQGATAEELAEKYNANLEAIVYYNNLNEKNLNDIKEIKIPSSFDYIDNRLNQLSKTLNNLNPFEKITTEKEIQALKQKQLLQKQTASAFMDDDYIYFKLHLPEGKSISAENFKKLFDIKDGALRENNDIKGEWRDDNTPDKKQYLDFSNTLLEDNKIYRVKLNDINIDNIYIQ